MDVTGIYEKLMNHWDNNKYGEYMDQDLKEAGKIDCEELYLNDPLEGEDKNNLSRILIEKILENKQSISVDKDIIVYLNEFLLVRYYFAFIDKLNVIIKENMITKDEIFKLAKKYIINSNDIQGIKFGLTLLRYCDSKEALKMLKAFSNHNEFIFFAIEGIKEYPKCNSIIFEIAQNAKGYGKIIAVSNLEVVDDKIKNWLIEEGCNNEFLEPVLVALTYNEEDYYNYFCTGKKSKEKFSLFTDRLMQMAELKGFFAEHVSYNIIVSYADYFKKYKKSFAGVYVMCALLSLFRSLDENEERVSDYLSLNLDEKSVVNDIIQEFIHYNLKDIILETLNSNKYDINDILDVAIALSIELSYDDFIYQLDKNNFNLSVYNYLVLHGKNEDLRKLLEFAKDKVPFDLIAKGPEVLKEEGLNLDYIPDSCLYLLVVATSSMVNDYIDLNLKALKARYLPTRKTAFENIRSLKFEDQSPYLKYIEELCQCEVDHDLKGSILRFLHEHKNTDKKRQYEKLGPLKVKPHSKDVFLTETNIAGIKYVDLTMVENRICINEQVYLKREPDNPFDPNAIMVLTNKGYVIGYIPKKDNYILKNLMDWGKVIYGIITHVDSDYSNIEISLYLSYIDVIKEVADTVNMVSVNRPGYLN